MRTNWDGIEEFVAVATCMGFKPAAQMLNVSTSHVSRAVSKLENAIGVPLLYRTTRKVSLTTSPRAARAHCPPRGRPGELVKLGRVQTR